MLLRSMLGGALVLGLLSMVQNKEQLIVCRILQGALTGTVGASVALVASVTPERRTGIALGMMQGAVFAGVAIGSLVGGMLIDHFGYRRAFLVGACLLLAGGLLVALGVREEFKPPDSAPEKAGKKRNGFREVLAASGFLATVLVVLSVWFGNSTFVPAFPLLVRELRGAAPGIYTATGIIVSVAAIASGVSCVVFGRLLDVWGHKRLLVIFSLAAAAASLSHVFARSVVQLYIMRACLGFAVGGIIPAANVAIRRVTASRNIGKAYGAAASISSLGWALGPFMGGWVGAHYGLRTPFILAAVAQVGVTILAAIFVRDSVRSPAASTAPSEDAKSSAIAESD